MGLVLDIDIPQLDRYFFEIPNSEAFTSMATVSNASAEDRSTGVQDYLNDKIQIPTDLDTIDSLLLGVKDQQDLLKKQVSVSRRTFHILLLTRPS